MNTKEFDKRGIKRTKMVAGLRLSISKPQAPNLLVHTLDISSSGAMIGALRERIEPGSVLFIQRRHIRAQCRVMWSRQLAPGEVQIGIEFLGHDARFWGLDLEDGCAEVWLSATER
jgi:PilZ domain-containing protein